MEQQGGATRTAKCYRWSFGIAQFDESRWQLSVSGDAVELERKPLEVLQYLLRHAGEAVTKEELLNAVWAGRIVVEAVMTNAVGKLRKALGDEAQAIVTTLPRIGYRLSVPVSRSPIEFLPQASRLQAGDPVPRRQNWRLDTQLARTVGNEVWLARHGKTREVRVFKFSLAGEGLQALKREVTIARLLREALGERDDFVRVIDWDFEAAPYFVESEYGGLSLDHWPRTRSIAQVPQSERLELFAAAVDAVAAAHSIGVLHKDLKPANILVEGEGSAARLRVADFGSSRVLDAGRLDELGITHLGLTQTQSISPDSGTLLYLSPEVVAGHSATIGSDVYALGVTLYQLLVGDFRRPMAPGWEQDIDDPLMRQDIADAANGDPARRLGSAAELAERIRTLVSRRERRAMEMAVQARVAEGERRLAKARARRPWVIAACVALLAGLGGTGWQLKRSAVAERVAAAQRDRAEAQAARAEAVVKFLSIDLIGAVSPGGSGFERDPTIKELLGHVSASMGDKFTDDPATRGSVHGALGVSWRTLGDREQGERHLRLAVEAYRQAFGNRDEQTLRTQYELVGMLAYAGKFDEAHALLEETDALAGSRLDEESLIALRAALLRGVLLVQQQKVTAAVPALEHADVLQRRIMAGDGQVGTGIRVNLSDAYLRTDRLEDAERLLRDTLADPRYDAARIGQTNAAALRVNLARALRNQGRFDEALPVARAAVQATESVMGPDQYQTLVQKSTLASIHYRAGDCPASLALMREVHAGMARNYGDQSRTTLVEAGNLADKEYECGDREAGFSLNAKILAAWEGSGEDSGSGHAQVRRFIHATMLTEQGEYEAALKFLVGLEPELLTASDSTPGWSHRLAAVRGEVLIRRGDVEEGRALLVPALRALEALAVADADDVERWQSLLFSTR